MDSVRASRSTNLECGSIRHSSVAFVGTPTESPLSLWRSPLLLASAPDARAAQRNKAPGQLDTPTARDVHRMEALKEEVRHQLVMLPYYSVFDWLQAEVKPDGSVTLMGQVVRPTLKDDAEAR